MNKVDILNNYIEKCDLIISSNEAIKAKLLQSEIIGVFNSEIKNITSNLTNYSYVKGADFISDLNILRAKLVNYKINIEEDERQKKYELEKLKLQQSITTINNQNTNNATANASSENTIKVLFEQAIKNISKMNDLLSNTEIEELEDKMSAVETAIRGTDKKKVIDKIGNVLKFVTEKGVEVSIAVLPYLGEVSKFFEQLFK